METKPGVRTTEFWLTLVVQLLQVLNIAGAWNFAPNKYSVIVSGVTAALYAVARGLAKAGVPASVPTDALAGLIASRLATQPTPPQPTAPSPSQPQT